MTVAKKKIDEVSVVDQLVDDANPPEYPDGAPVLTSWHHLYPRSRRAEFKRHFGTFRERQAKLNAARDAGVFEEVDEATVSDDLQDARVQVSADADDLFDLMDTLLRLCATDPAAYVEWSRKAGDGDLAKVFEVFMVRSQLGEVSGSTS